MTTAPRRRRTRKTLRVGIVARVHSLDPRQARDLVSTLAVQQIFETAVRGSPRRRRGAAGPVHGAAAGRGRRPALGRRAARHHVLRRDAAHRRPGRGFAEQASKPCASRRASRPAGDRVTFTLLKPNPRFDLALTLNHAAIVLEKDGRQLGTGAFIPAPGSTLEAVRLVRNPHYRARPALDEIALTVYASNQDGRPEALIRAVEAGEVDFTTIAVPHRRRRGEGRAQGASSPATPPRRCTSTPSGPSCAARRCGAPSPSPSTASRSPRCRTRTRWPSPPPACCPR